MYTSSTFVMSPISSSLPSHSTQHQPSLLTPHHQLPTRRHPLLFPNPKQHPLSLHRQPPWNPRRMGHQLCSHLPCSSSSRRRRRRHCMRGNSCQCRVTMCDGGAHRAFVELASHCRVQGMATNQCQARLGIIRAVSQPSFWELCRLSSLSIR